MFTQRQSLYSSGKKYVNPHGRLNDSDATETKHKHVAALVNVGGLWWIFNAEKFSWQKDPDPVWVGAEPIPPKRNLLKTCRKNQNLWQLNSS